MKNKIVFLMVTFLMVFSVGVYAMENSESSSGNGSGESGGGSGESENIKATITLRPEDNHPNGINMEVGTASYWLQVEASYSGEEDAVISYQWYESKDGSMDSIVPVPNETNSVFIPEQKIGTTYYCVGVMTTAKGKTNIEYTKLLEATFTPKIIDKIWIIGVNEPVPDEEISNEAEPDTDDELNKYYGYDIIGVSWTPDDKVFRKGVKYTANIDIEYWEDTEFVDKLEVKVNNQNAKLEKTGDTTARISYTFETTGNEHNAGENSNEHNASGDIENNNNSEMENNSPQDESISMPAIILTTICIVLIIFALFVIIKKN